MILYKNKSAFTLIELVVWITILWILAFSVANIDFNRLSNKQKLDIFANKIKTSYETIRNNALSWKWIWTDLTVPSKWAISFSKTNSWTISWEAYDKDNNIIDRSILLVPNSFEINSIKCWEYWEDKSSYWDMTSTWTIEFSWINLKLDINSDLNCNQDKDKVLEITVKNKVENKVITINTLNWLVNISK